MVDDHRRNREPQRDRERVAKHLRRTPIAYGNAEEQDCPRAAHGKPDHRGLDKAGR